MKEKQFKLKKIDGITNVSLELMKQLSVAPPSCKFLAVLAALAAAETAEGSSDVSQHVVTEKESLRQQVLGWSTYLMIVLITVGAVRAYSHVTKLVADNQHEERWVSDSNDLHRSARGSTAPVPAATGACARMRLDTAPAEHCRGSGNSSGDELEVCVSRVV